MQVKTIYNNNAPDTYGVFGTAISPNTGVEFVRFGTPPIAVFDTELEAWEYLNANSRNSGKQGG